MKLSIVFVSLLLLVFSCSNKPTLDELKKFAAVESYEQDHFLDTVSNKKALVIIAHDDDDCLMAGTIAKLSAQGWEIQQLSFQVTPLAKGASQHPSEIICQGNEAILADRDYRNGLDTTKYQYLPFPKEQMNKVFKKTKIRAELIKKINDFRPSVIFTLDNEMGGYGHPEHVFISQLVLDLSLARLIHPLRIYQGVYTKPLQI